MEKAAFLKDSILDNPACIIVEDRAILDVAYNFTILTNGLEMTPTTLLNSPFGTVRGNRKCERNGTGIFDLSHRFPQIPSALNDRYYTLRFAENETFKTYAMGRELVGTVPRFARHTRRDEELTIRG